jgi:hypothetical protein
MRPVPIASPDPEASGLGTGIGTSPDASGPEVIMPFRLNHLGDDEANDIPHFEEDDELGSVRNETLEEEADEELMVPTERDSMNVPPPTPAPPKKKKSAKRKVRRGGKSKSKARRARPKKSKTRRGGKARKTKSRPRKKSKSRRRGKGRKRR